MQRVSDTEVIVIGLGIAGAAILDQLAERGVPAIGIEARAQGHQFGSSHGYSRATRAAVGEGVAYLPLVQRSDAIWDMLERRGYDLRRHTGLLYLARGGAESSRHGDSDFIRATRAVAEAGGVALEGLDCAALRARFPQFLISDDSFGYLEPGAGVLRPEACIVALCTEAASHGAVLRYDEPVRQLATDGAKVIVDTPAGRYRAAKVVLAMGGWTPGFVQGTYGRDLKVFRQLQYWFATEREDLWEQARSPAFLWFHGATADDVFYGFPMLDGGQRAVKVAAEQYATACDPDALDSAVSTDEIAAMYATHVRGRLAGVTDHCVQALACSYTHNTNPAHQGRFMIGAHPAIDHVTVVSACSGHGFKHAPGIAEAVVQSLIGEVPFCDLSMFAP